MFNRYRAIYQLHPPHLSEIKWKDKTNFNIDTLLYLEQKTKILPNMYIQKCFFLEYQL